MMQTNTSKSTDEKMSLLYLGSSFSSTDNAEPNRNIETQRTSVAMTMRRIKINVGGTVFSTLGTTLQSIPGSKLASLETHMDEHYDLENKEYYFDRDPNIFNSILNLYRTGSLHLPKDVCGIQFQKELEYWGIPPTMISNCCWETYYKPMDDIELFEYLSEEFCQPEMKSVKYESAATDQKNIISHCNAWRKRIWVFLMNPNSSIYAKIWYWIYMAVILLSIVTYFIDTFDYCREIDQDLPHPRNMSSKHKLWKTFGARQIPSIRVISVVCNVMFTVELFIRFIVSENKVRFCKCFLNTADLISTIGFLIVINTRMDFMKHMYSHCERENGEMCMSDGISVKPEWIDDNSIYILIFGHLLLSFRNFRFYRLGRMIKILKLLILAIRKSARELGLLVLVILINAIVFAGLIFYAELLYGNHFNDYFEAFYWSVITMTTIGYGDVYPEDIPGRIVAVLCSITGLFLLTMPVAVISSKFNDLHSRVHDRERHEKNMKLYNSAALSKVSNKNHNRQRCTKTVS